MRREIDEIPAALDRLLTDGADDIRAIAVALRAADPAFLVTVARGSSDHACTYLKYAAELLLGLPVASVGPSVASVWGAPLRLRGGVCIAVSQSGRSPDIVELTRAARQGGARVVAVTNHPASPLAAAAEATIDTRAGPEQSVAATKSFVTSAVACLWLLAEVKGDAALLAAIRGLPELAAQALDADWSPMIEAAGDGSMFTIGRGPSWAMAGEAALKFKETCLIHAESYSAAEVMHGPVALVGRGFPVLAFAASDAAEAATAEAAAALAAKGARVFVTSRLARGATALPAIRTAHWLADPIPLIVSFHAMVERLALSRGIDPDLPRHLAKVTETR